ncbi:MAG: SIS domain-containing protein [Deinococcales bacterium]
MSDSSKSDLTKERGQYTRQEIFSQPQVWQEGLAQLQGHLPELQAFLQQPFKEILFTGCGSTYYLALAAAGLCRALGKQARALPASEIWLNSDFNRGEASLLIAVSRSGTTSETLHAAKHFKNTTRGKVLSFCCYPEASLNQLSDLRIILAQGQEESVAQTRAFSLLYLATVFLNLVLAQRESELSQLEKLPVIADNLLSQGADVMRQLAHDPHFDRFYFLGSGSRYGLAAELSLKMKEMSLSHSEPFHVMEFRHGPMSMVTASTLIICLLSQQHYEQEVKLLNELKARGATILSLGERGAEVNFYAELDDHLNQVLYLPLGQYLAFEKAMSKGLDPDRPQGLTAVIVLE